MARAFDAVIFDMEGVLADSEPMHREITRAMLAVYGIPHPDEVEEELVEDSRHGALAAKAAGMRCAAIPCGLTHNLDLTAADWRLTSLLELPRVLTP